MPSSSGSQIKRDAEQLFCDDEMNTTETDELPPSNFGTWKVEKEIPGGAQADVYRVHAEGVRRDFLIETIEAMDRDLKAKE